jgi:hypothetical protein
VSVAPGFEKFMIELLASPFAESAAQINAALSALDLEADGNVSAERMLAGLEYIATEPQPIERRVAKMAELVALKGKVVIDMKAFCGW